MSDVALKAAPTRRARKKARTRGQIYDAAMELFAERGYAAVSIAEICEAADVGRGTFFLHFPAKAALLYEFNERFAEKALAIFTEPRASAKTEITILVERMSKELKARAEIMRAMLSEFYASPQPLAAAHHAGQTLSELVTSIIERGQQSGEFNRDVDARLATASFFATSAAILNGQVFRKGEISSREVNRQFLRHVFHGLAP